VNGVDTTARDIRRAVIAMAARRQRPGYGSLLSGLEREVVREPWWEEVERALSGVPHVVVGGVAANAYMAPRFTRDLDVGILPADRAAAEGRLEAAGWRPRAPTRPLDPNLDGWAWAGPAGRQLDLFAMRHPWAEEAIHQAQVDTRTGLPTLAAEFLVLMKLTVSRTIDLGDLSRMLGSRSDAELDRVRAAVRRYQPDDLEDVEQLIVLGRMERDRQP
jgi:hypothetical protein